MSLSNRNSFISRRRSRGFGRLGGLFGSRKFGLYTNSVRTPVPYSLNSTFNYSSEIKYFPGNPETSPSVPVRVIWWRRAGRAYLPAGLFHQYVSELYQEFSTQLFPPGCPVFLAGKARSYRYQVRCRGSLGGRIVPDEQGSGFFPERLLFAQPAWRPV